MLEAAEADLALEAGFVHVKARQAFPEIGRQVRTRTNRVSGFAMAASVLSRAARRTSSTQAAGPSEGVGPRVRIRLAPGESLQTSGRYHGVRRDSSAERALRRLLRQCAVGRPDRDYLDIRSR